MCQKSKSDSVYYIFCIMHADNQPVSNQTGILTQIKHLSKAFDSLYFFFF